MSGFYGPTGPIVPTDHRTVIRRFWTLAPHLVEAIALPVAFVAPLFDKEACIVVGSALALIVYDIPVSKERPVILVESRHLVECQVMRQHGRCICGIVWTAPQIDDLQAGDGFLQSHSACRDLGLIEPSRRPTRKLQPRCSPPNWYTRVLQSRERSYRRLCNTPHRLPLG